jgi:hypothetical protein
LHVLQQIPEHIEYLHALLALTRGGSMIGYD